MKNFVAVALLAVTLLATVSAAWADTKPAKGVAPKAGLSVTVPPLKIKPQSQPFEVTGEVVDSWCYASKVVGDGRGPEHKLCADACAHGGVTMAIVDDAGNMYMAVKTKAYTGCQHLLEPFVAKRVHVTGWIARAGGCQLLKIDKVEEVKDSKTAAAAAPSKKKS